MQQIIRKSRLKWIGKAPVIGKKVVLLIPQFNEFSNGLMEERLRYFQRTSEEVRQYMDVILIDDGSSDDSLKVLTEFKLEHPDAFFLASVKPNANKVGALHLAVLSINHELVILSDFDTDILGLQDGPDILNTLRKDPDLMGCYFRLLPFEGSGNIFAFQQLEYSLQRSLYRFHRKDRTVAVMPGAGSCFRRDVLIKIYSYHSGLRNGEDREATLLGIKLGYQTLYWNDVQILTRTPPTFKSLVKQRIRWNLGYLETIQKESGFYLAELRKHSSFGLRALVDMLDVAFLMLLPFIFLMIGLFMTKILIPFFILSYIGYATYCIHLTISTPTESVEFKNKRIRFILYFPILKITLDYLSWTGAFFNLIRKSGCLKKCQSGPLSALKISQG